MSSVSEPLEGLMDDSSDMAFTLNQAQEQDDDIQQDSQLLRLPPELRLKIWRLVLGQRTVHVKVPEEEDEVELDEGDGGFGPVHQCKDSDCVLLLHQECPVFVDEEDPDTGIMNPIIHAVAWPDCDDSHCFCQFVGNLELIQTCRVMHDEIKPLLWATTLFSFCGVYSLEIYMDLLSDEQKGLIRKVHLAVQYIPATPEPRVSLDTINSLGGVNELSLSIGRFFRDRYELRKFKKSKSFRARRARDIMPLCGLHLLKVRVAFECLGFAGERTAQPPAINLSACSNFAAEVRTMLLNPDGKKEGENMVSNGPRKGQKANAGSSDSSSEESFDTEPDEELEDAAANLFGWYDYSSLLIKDDDGISTAKGSERNMGDTKEAGN